jgi:hypothetical protein
MTIFLRYIWGFQRLKVVVEEVHTKPVEVSVPDKGRGMFAVKDGPSTQKSG